MYQRGFKWKEDAPVSSKREDRHRVVQSAHFRDAKPANQRFADHDAIFICSGSLCPVVVVRKDFIDILLVAATGQDFPMA